MLRVCENENAVGDNLRLLTKIKRFSFRSVVWVLVFLLLGFWVFANFGLGLQVLAPPKAYSMSMCASPALLQE